MLPLFLSPSDLGVICEPDGLVRCTTCKRSWRLDLAGDATVRIGELSAALDRAEAHGGKVWLPSGGKSKAEVLESAGISTSEAHRAEKLASNGGLPANWESLCVSCNTTQAHEDGAFLSGPPPYEDRSPAWETRN